MSFKGIFGESKKLCTHATRRLCNAIEASRPTSPAKFILMNTVGVPNPDLRDQRTWFERGVLTLLRCLIPPHRDNETAAEHLHTAVSRENKHLDWCSVRPDSLIDAEVSPYNITESPVTGIFTGRPTTRATVAPCTLKRLPHRILEYETVTNGDVANPRGGIRGCIPAQQNY